VPLYPSNCPDLIKFNNSFCISSEDNTRSLPSLPGKPCNPTKPSLPLAPSFPSLPSFPFIIIGFTLFLIFSFTLGFIGFSTGGGGTYSVSLINLIIYGRMIDIGVKYVNCLSLGLAEYPRSTP